MTRFEASTSRIQVQSVEEFEETITVTRSMWSSPGLCNEKDTFQLTLRNQFHDP
jgi:hypothetical protein